MNRTNPDIIDCIRDLQAEVKSWKRHYEDRQQGLIEAEAEVEKLRAAGQDLHRMLFGEKAPTDDVQTPMGPTSHCLFCEVMSGGR